MLWISVKDPGCRLPFFWAYPNRTVPEGVWKTVVAVGAGEEGKSRATRNVNLNGNAGMNKYEHEHIHTHSESTDERKRPFYLSRTFGGFYDTVSL